MFFTKAHLCDMSVLSKCTESKDHQKVVTRHIWQDYMEEADVPQQNQVQMLHNRTKSLLSAHQSII